MSVTTPYGSLDSLEEALVRMLGDLRDLRDGEMPRSEDLANALVLDYWAYGIIPTPCLVGEDVGHRILGKRSRIHTSQLVLVDSCGKWARTWSRFYRLRTPARSNVVCGNA